MKDIKTLLLRNIKFLENIFFEGVVRGLAERIFINNNSISHKILFNNIIVTKLFLKIIFKD